MPVQKAKAHSCTRYNFCGRFPKMEILQPSLPSALADGTSSRFLSGFSPNYTKRIWLKPIRNSVCIPSAKADGNEREIKNISPQISSIKYKPKPAPLLPKPQLSRSSAAKTVRQTCSKVKPAAQSKPARSQCRC